MEKITMEQAMNMSLDDYINLTGITTNLSKKKSKSNQCDFDVDMQVDMPNVDSQQWRLLPPNQGVDREPGMPPLVPIQSSHNITRRNRGGNQKWTYNDREYLNEESAVNNLDTREIQVELGNIRIRKSIHGKSNNKGTKKPYNRRPNTSVQNRLTLNRSNALTYTILNEKSLNGHKKKNNINNNNKINRSDSLVYGNVYNKVSQQNRSLPSLLDINIPVNGLNGINGITDIVTGRNAVQNTDLTVSTPGMAFLRNSMEIMPTLAEKLFDQIQSIQKNFENKYDMRMQKEISQMQGKTLLYKCGGPGGVVSFDGPGINCVSLLHKTDVSMNQRFG